MQRTKIALVALTIVGLYWLLLFVGTHIPLKPGKNQAPAGRDKVQHCVAFAGLAFLLCTAGAIDGRYRRALVPRVLLLIAVYAAADEWTQQFVPSRQSDLSDWIADMVGAGLGLSVFLLVGEPVLALLPRSRIRREAAAADSTAAPA